MTTLQPGPLAVLFDLDGTLVDTAPDLAGAANVVRAARGLAPLPLESYRDRITRGADALVRIALALPAHAAPPAAAVDEFLNAYRGRIAHESTLFPTVPELLASIEGRGWRWGVVTNKPGRFTEPLLDALGIAARAGCIVSGDSTARPKPHPEPLLAAAALLGTSAGRCAYVGDAAADIRAGKRAGMRTVAALFGYLERDDDGRSWGADAVIERPLDLLDCLADWPPGPTAPAGPSA